MLTTFDQSTRFVLAEGVPLVANLAALWAADPVLAMGLEERLEEETYPTVAARSGDATVSIPAGGGQIFLHSRHRPVDEAKRLVDSADLNDKTLIAVHGFGLGYHVEELFRRASPEAIFLVFEPDFKLLHTAFAARDFSELIRSRRVYLVTRADRSTLMLRIQGNQALACVGVTSVMQGPSVQVQPDFHRTTAAMLEDVLAYCRTSINTLVLNGRRTCENIAGNIPWYLRCGGINDLKNAHTGRPAIIVSAGPSLRKNMHLLRQAREKTIIIATQTTLRPLLDIGVEPHYVTSLDYHDICTRFFENLPEGLSTTLVAEPKASARMFGLFTGPIRLLGNDFADRLLAPLKIEKDRLRAGATVAHLAFYLAEYLACDPIVFVGQDLGFSDGLAYTPGTSYEDVWRPELSRFCTMEMKQWEHIARERPILRKIPDVAGRAMYTEQRLFSYLQQFERDFATSKARVIDASEGGALKRGAVVMTLAEAIQKMSGTVRPTEAFVGPAVPDISSTIDVLKNRLEESKKIEKIAQETLPLLENVGTCLDDQPRVNQLIARIDSLRAKMLQLNDCYELITALSQQSELERFRQDRQLAASRATGLDRQKGQLKRDIANVKSLLEATAAFQTLVTATIQKLKENR
ncbi:MAG TPA: 6-hydroxymethylpterin diphosphokinase MptE-like protein [Tepidisphaeraceae bacterium]|nr:6-hydroxymethylpterin diphosphokinase MptE-like protein [Tepidisphaeraceae bacterium]